MSLIIQYIIVGTVLLGAAVYVGLKLFRLRRKGKIDSCCGCSLSDACNKKQTKTDCHENH